MPLASLNDINVFLPQDKLSATDVDVDGIAKESIDSETIIKSRLSGTFSPTTLASWSTPSVTPRTIRSIAGRLVAALLYARAFSGDVTDVPEYAQSLYNQAMGLMDGIIDGSIIVIDGDDVVVDSDVGRLTSDDFTPNAATTPGPMFSVSDRF